MIQSNQTLNNLTVRDLENLIETIVKRNLKPETNQPSTNNQTLLDTFGQWEDEQTDEEIIEQIYNSRNSNLNSISKYFHRRRLSKS
jgi:hypothetical protein